MMIHFLTSKSVGCEKVIHFLTSKSVSPRPLFDQKVGKVDFGDTLFDFWVIHFLTKKISKSVFGDTLFDISLINFWFGQKVCRSKSVVDSWNIISRK